RRLPRSTLFPYATLFRSELEPLDDLAARRRRRRRRERDARHAGKALAQPVQREVVLPKVMSPLRYAVRFVDRDDRHGNRSEQVRSEEHTSELQSRENLVC